jgi:hypothetical protein
METEDLGKITISELKRGECMSCGQSMGHTKVYSLVAGYHGDDILEFQQHFHCCWCRKMNKKLKDLDKQIAILEQKKIDNEFEIFTRQLNKYKN